jgi:single-strand DNA-binding protein
MANMNSVVLIGRITRDIEVQRTQSGVPFARFTIAIDRPVSQNQNQNQNGQQQAQSQSQVDFIPVTVWNKQAENVAQYCGKGSLVAVSGALRTYKYQDKQNPDTSHTGFEVRAANVQFLVSKRPGGNAGAPNANAGNAGYAGNAGNNNYGNNNGYGSYGNSNNAGNAGNTGANANYGNAGNNNYGTGNNYYGNAGNAGGYGNGNAGNANYGGANNGYADTPVDGDPFGDFGDVQF